MVFYPKNQTSIPHLIIRLSRLISGNGIFSNKIFIPESKASYLCRSSE